MPSPCTVGRPPNVRDVSRAARGRGVGGSREDVGKGHGVAPPRSTVRSVFFLHFATYSDALFARIRGVKKLRFFRYHQGMPPTSLELSTLGHRIRHQRVSHGFTLDELGERVGVAGSQLSLIENGKREPKLSLLQAIAAETGVRGRRPAVDRAAQPARGARDRARARAAQLGVPPAGHRAGQGHQEHERRHDRVDPRPAPRAAAPRARGDRDARGGAARQHRAAAARCGTSTTTSPDIEKLAEKQLKSAGHVSGALTHRTVSIMAEQLGFELIYVSDLPHSARSVTDLEHGRIYLPPASIPGGHGLRSMALQAMAHRLLGHQRPTDYADFLQQRLEINYYAACVPHARDRVGRVPARRRRRTATSPSRTSATRSASTHESAGDAPDEPRHAASRHPAALPAGRRLGRDHPRLRERRPAAADGCHRRRRRPDRVPQVVGAVGVRRSRTARPSTTSTPTPRPARSGARRRPAPRRTGEFSITVGVPFDDAKWFRGRETQKRARLDVPRRVVLPPRRSSDVAARWQGKAWPSARVHMQMFSPLPRGAFPGRRRQRGLRVPRPARQG